MKDFNSLIDQALSVADASSLTFEPLDAQSMGFKFGPHAGRGVVLQRDTALELGAGGLSCGMIIPTSDTNLVTDGRISVCGMDVEDLIARCAEDELNQAPFGQAILVAGADISPANLSVLEDCLYTKDYIDGYFVRSSEGRIHSRISRRLADAGFGLRGLGSALIQMVKEACPAVESVEIVFVTESGKPFDELVALRSEWLSRTHDTRKGIWLEKGLDIDCPAGGHCGQCADKELCNNVREIAKIRRKGQ